MGYETLGSSTFQPPRSSGPAPLRAAPLGSSTQSQPAFPETQTGWDPNRLRLSINAEDAAKVIQVGASAPGYVMERPLAALDTVTGGGVKSGIDQAGDTIRGIPVLGDLLSGGAQAIGNTYEGINRLTRAPINGGMAKALRETAGMDPDARVDGLTAFLSGAGGIAGDLTVRQLREIGMRRGFTEQDIADLVSGKRGYLDFADKALSDNPLVDLGGSLALDPTNYLALGVATTAAKGAVAGTKLLPGGTQLVGAGARLAQMTGLQKLATGVTSINEAVGVSRYTAKGTVAGMQALRSGEVAGVTLNTLSRHLAMAFRGSSDFLRTYRRAAYATTGAQIAVQAVGDAGVLDNTPLGGLYEPLYRAAKEMGENKPLSNGGMYNLWAALNFPIRRDLHDAWTETKKYGLGIGAGKATVRTPLFKRVNQVEKDVILELAPGMDISTGRRALQGPDGFGSDQNLTDMILHFARSLYAERELPKMNAFNMQAYSTAEFATKSAALTKYIEQGTLRALEDGTITGRDIVQHMKDSHVGPRSTEYNKETGQARPKAGAVDQAWDPQDFIHRWSEWTQRMNDLALRSGFHNAYGVVVGVADGALPKEWLEVARAQLNAIKRSDGTISKRDMDKFLEQYPALTVDANDPSNFFARLRHPDSGEVHAQAAIQRIDSLKKDAISLREYLYDVEKWEARATRLKAKRGSVLDENGNIDPTRAPDIGNAAVLGITQQGRVRQVLGVDDTYDDLLQKRSEPTVRQREDIILPAFEDLGFTANAATQGVMSIGGQHRTAVAVHFPTAKGPAEVELAAAILAEQTKSPYTVAMISGEAALRQHGLTENAAHVRFDIGRMGRDEADTILRLVTEKFDGRFELNDTAGVLHVLVRQEDALAAQSLQRDIAGIVGEQRTRMTAQPAWVSVVKNDTRGAIRSGRTVRSDATASAILARHATDIRAVNRRAAFRRALDERGRVVGEDAPGFVRGPEQSRYDDLGDDGQPGVVARPASTSYSEGMQDLKVQVTTLTDRLDSLATAAEKLRKKRGKTNRDVMDLDATNAEYQRVSEELLGLERKANRLAEQGTEVDRAAYREAFPDDLGYAVGGFKGRYMTDMMDEGAPLPATDAEDIALRVKAGRKALQSSSSGVLLKGDREELAARAAFLDQLEASARPAPSITDGVRAADTSGTQGQVLWLAEAEDAISQFAPRLGDDLRGLPDEEWAKIAPMEAELRRFDPQYRLKVSPALQGTIEAGKQGRNAPTYYFGQGNAIKDVLAVSRATSDLMYHKVWKPAADFQNALFGRVYTRRLSDEAKQLLYGEILAKTAHLPDDVRPRIKDIDSFLQTLDAAAQNSKLFASQLYAKGDALPPGTIAEIANGSFTGRFVGIPKSEASWKAMQNLPVFRGFSPEALQALGGAGSVHKILDKTGSRFYRDLRERTRGKGQMGRLIREVYATGRTGTATPRHYVRTFYHLFRFTLDPRWHLLNRLEADVLGYSKYGVSRFNGVKSADAVDNAVRLHGGGLVDGESDLLRDALASGFLDARHLEGYIGRSFKKGRMRSTRDVLRTMAAEDPSIVTLRRRFGGTEDEWVNGLEEMMYEFDTKGVRETVMTEAQKILDERDMETLAPLLTELYKRNNQVFRDAVQTFHGNTNRGNLERIMNSYFLFWPISYQIKATKWLFDVLTKQSVGRQTNLGGVWFLDRMMQEHARKLATDEGYQRMFVDNPALWQTAAMLLPVTPFDLGVGLSRITRYSLSAGGFIKDEGFNEDPFMKGLGLLKIGFPYTVDTLMTAYRQSKDKPKELVVPLEPAA